MRALSADRMQLFPILFVLSIPVEPLSGAVARRIYSTTAAMHCRMRGLGSLVFSCLSADRMQLFPILFVLFIPVKTLSGAFARRSVFKDGQDLQDEQDDGGDALS